MSDNPYFIPTPKRRRDKAVVTVITQKRYYIYGRGYNSELEAYMQIAKREIWNEFYDAYRRYSAPYEMKSHQWCGTHRIMNFEQFRSHWYGKRYPAREGCLCHFCSRFKHSFDPELVIGGIPSGGGCWIAKMADYRKIAREIMRDIRLGFRTPDGKELRALQERT